MSTEEFGKYRIERRLATGGMAELFVGFLQGAKGFERKVAIKRILPHLAADSAFQSMFWDEATLAANLSHPNIVQVLDFGEESGQLFMALEFVDGVDLKTLGRELSKVGRVLSAAELALVAEGVASGLHHVHTAASQTGEPLNIIHRDISPHNVMVSRDGHVKVMDFGVAHAEVRASQTATGVLKGKLAYMAPEQANDQELDHRVDQFALGLLLWELAVGEAAYQGPNDAVLLRKVLSRDLEPLQVYRNDLPEAFSSLVMKMLEKAPEDRFDTMDAVYRAALQVRFSLGESGATATLAGLLGQPNPTVSKSPVGTTISRSETKLSATSTLPNHSDDHTSRPLEITAALPDRVVQPTAVTKFETQRDLSDEAPTRLYEETEEPRRTPNIALLGFITLGLLSLAGFLGSRLIEAPDQGREVELKPVVSDKAEPPTRSLQGMEATETAEPRAVQADTPPVATERVSAKTESGGPPAPSLATESKPKPKTKLKPKPKSKQRAKPQGRGEQPAAVSNTSKRSPLGTLQLRVEEGWYNVMLGNRRLGTTPLGGVSLPVGQHLLVLDNPVTGERREVRVKISAGDVTRVSVGAN